MKKTAQMRLMELENGGRDIRDLMADAYREGGNFEGAAARLGIGMSTLTLWVRNFGGRIANDIVFDGYEPAPEPLAEVA